LLHAGDANAQCCTHGDGPTHDRSDAGCCAAVNPADAGHTTDRRCVPCQPLHSCVAEHDDHDPTSHGHDSEPARDGHDSYTARIAFGRHGSPRPRARRTTRIRPTRCSPPHGDDGHDAGDHTGDDISQSTSHSVANGHDTFRCSTRDPTAAAWPAGTTRPRPSTHATPDAGARSTTLNCASAPVPHVPTHDAPGNDCQPDNSHVAGRGHARDCSSRGDRGRHDAPHDAT
jgi:hypothetical protein